MLTNISLKKLVDKPEVGDKMPSHAIIAADNNYQNKTTVGKLWFKSGEYGNYLSGGLNKENRTYQKKDGTTGEDKAYVIITLDEYNKLTNVVTGKGYDGALGEAPKEDIPF